MSKTAAFYLLISSVWTFTHAATVEIRFIDRASQSLIPVRVELHDAENNAVIANNALEISGECALAPLPSWLAQPAPKSLFNPFTGSEQHYVNGVGRYELDPGTYRVRAFKGPEYQVADLELVVIDSTETQSAIVLAEPWLTVYRWNP